jgi:putative FmdB family regulatory protein
VAGAEGAAAPGEELKGPPCVPGCGTIASDEEKLMPIYEYACPQCGHEFEALVRSGTTPECPTCHSTRLDKKLSVFATASADAAPQHAMPEACASCGHPGGPGACAFD